MHVVQFPMLKYNEFSNQVTYHIQIDYKNAQSNARSLIKNTFATS